MVGALRWAAYQEFCWICLNWTPYPEEILVLPLGFSRIDSVSLSWC